MPAISLERLNNCYLVTPTNCLFLKEKNREHPPSVQGASPAVPSVPWRRSPGVCQSSVTGELRTQAWGRRARGRGKATVSSQRLRSVRTAGRTTRPAQTGAASGPARAATATGERARHVCRERFPGVAASDAPPVRTFYVLMQTPKGLFSVLGGAVGQCAGPSQEKGGLYPPEVADAQLCHLGGWVLGCRAHLNPDCIF